MPVTSHDLRTDLRSLGIGPGDRAIVHSSLSAMGWVEGGADSVVNALTGAVGPEGTVLVPTFTPGTTEPFDPARTPSETGAITEALRRTDGAARSLHPTHSVAALGPDAHVLTTNHPFRESLGVDGPMHRAIRGGAKILLLGVGHERNSSVHVAEKLAALPFKGLLHERGLRIDGEEHRVDVSRVGCSQGFGRVETAAERAGILTRGTVGEADVQLMDGGDLLRIARDLLSEPTALLCANPDCWWCPEARSLCD